MIPHNIQKMTRGEKKTAKSAVEITEETLRREMSKPHQNKNEEKRGGRTQSRLKRATYPTDETTEKCERAEWRKRSCKSLL